MRFRHLIVVFLLFESLYSGAEAEPIDCRRFYSTHTLRVLNQPIEFNFGDFGTSRGEAYRRKGSSFKINLPNNKIIDFVIPTENSDFYLLGVQTLEKALSQIPIWLLQHVDQIVLTNGASFVESVKESRERIQKMYGINFNDYPPGSIIKGEAEVYEFKKYIKLFRGFVYSRELGARFETLLSSPPEEILAHELGHLLAHSLFGSSEPSREYFLAKQKDGNEISVYGSFSLKEDFAEFIRNYIFGGKNFRNTHQARVEFLERKIKTDPEYVDFKFIVAK